MNQYQFMYWVKYNINESTANGMLDITMTLHKYKDFGYSEGLQDALYYLNRVLCHFLGQERIQPVLDLQESIDGLNSPCSVLHELKSSNGLVSLFGQVTGSVREEKQEELDCKEWFAARDQLQFKEVVFKSDDPEYADGQADLAPLGNGPLTTFHEIREKGIPIPKCMHVEIATLRGFAHQEYQDALVGQDMYYWRLVLRVYD